ncbi:Leucine Rich Repeat [Seminavis robusta]|uniref:Leucine Rich Repeat n=1 Tax=Seminavis robusta TaxID=568900 RepID=A0A9N8DZP3_9STRA|nr:Leucine Rich Repeat [Seminavis robusta]|eukprot:Sro503_g155840.1 Leucine Rich Repeat (451) ;mRNA; f:36143-37495
MLNSARVPKKAALATLIVAVASGIAQESSGLSFGFPDYTLAALHDASSPQSQALNWLKLHPNLSSLDIQRQKQLFALASIYFSFNGDWWPPAERNNWMDYEVHECDWPHSTPPNSSIHCNNGLFVDLDLSNIPNLHGATPKEVCFLENLESLSLDRNPDLGRKARTDTKLEGLLPTHLGEFTKLNRNPDLGRKERINTTLEDLLPTQLGELTKLSYISISGNTNLRGTLPSSIHYLTRLDSIWLDGNALTGSLAPQLFGLKNLRGLSLGYNNLTGTVPPAISNLQRLMSLSLQGSAVLSGSIPSQIGRLTDLIWLDLSGTGISSTIPSELGLLTALDVLKLDSTLLSGEIPKSLALIESLTKFDIGKTSLNGTIPLEMCKHHSRRIFFIDCDEVNCPRECDLSEEHMSSIYDRICSCVDEEVSSTSSFTTASFLSVLLMAMTGTYLGLGL